MAVAYDTITVSGDYYATPDPATVSHTPVGTPRGVIVYVIHVAESTTDVVGITYGGTSMTQVGTASSASGEPVAIDTYFLGSSISTGTQTVSVDHDATGGRKRTVVITFTASADTEVKAHGGDGNTTANPSVTINSGTDATYTAALATGRGVPSQVTPGTGMTELSEIDLGSLLMSVIRATTDPTSGSTAMAWTVAADDWAVYATAVGEVATSTTLVGSLFTSTANWYAGTADLEETLVGSLFTSTANWYAGTADLEETLVGTLFTSTANWYVGTVDSDNYLTAGAVFTSTANWYAGTAALSETLVGTLFTSTATFSAGTVDSDNYLTAGAVFTSTASFFAGTVDSDNYLTAAAAFTSTANWYAGTLYPATPFAGSLFTSTATWYAGTVDSDNYLTAPAVFTSTATFYPGALPFDVTLVGSALFTSTATWYTGNLSVSVEEGGLLSLMASMM